MAKPAQPKPPKLKKCRVCPEKSIPRNSLHICCSPSCAYKYTSQKSARKKAESDKAERKAWKKRKADSKPLSHWLNITQRVFNDYIRARDGNICISCGSITAIAYHAGHFKTVKSASQLRFNEDNCHSQCSACNIYQSGNIGPYRISLISKIGPQRVEALENNKTHHRYTREELERIRKRYRAFIREMTKQQEAAA